MKRRWGVWVTTLCLAAIADTAGAATREAPSARQILEATGVQGGLIIHLGCGEGKLTAALRANDGCLVHGLDADAINVSRARAHVRGLGVYGKVSVEQWTGARLPYADGIANLVVASDPGGVSTEEILRVLRPGGVAYLRKGSAWSKTVKPRQEGTDEWTHYLHDASGNAVAHDRLVGPPRRIQWVADPPHTRGHEHTPTVASLVSSGGRVFYLVDEASTSSILDPARWQLVARDAYNGVLLWKRPVAEWWPAVCGWTQGPKQLQRKLVAVGDRVYVTLGLHAPLTAIDAATGKTLRSYEGTLGTEEIVLHQGVLLLAVRAVTPERTAELRGWAQLSAQKGSPLYVRETAEPLLKRLRSTENTAEVSLLALAADTGRVLWKRATGDVAGLRPLSLCALGDRALYQKGSEIACVDLKTGRSAWSVPSPGPMRVVSHGYVVCADGKGVTALSVATGAAAWREDPLLTDIRDAFVVGGTVWLGGFRPFRGKNEKQGAAWGPYFAVQRDLATGKLLKQIEPENPGHHHRCYANKATERYILGGRRGTEFIDLQSGDVQWNSFARGVCMYGVMPCNGLLYCPPHACGCYAEAKLIGFHALAAEAPTRAGIAAGDPLQRGPAFGDGATGRRGDGETGRPGSIPPIADRQSQIANQDEWPQYRHDGARSGFTASVVPPALRPLWRAAVGGRLTPPTVAGGKVMVAAPEEHRLHTFDAASGQRRWEFTAGGRVDSPPALIGGRAIFGCRDGYVYSLRTTDGALGWRLRAARDERRVVALGQVESVSPVHGSVLVRDGVAFATAGRSTYLDGGIDLCRIQLDSGQVLSRTSIYSPDPETGRQPAQYDQNRMPGARSDILSSDDQDVYLCDQVFSLDGKAKEAGNPHLLTETGFLDDTWPHRSYWVFGTRCSMATGCSSRDKNLIFGRVLAFSDAAIYGYGRKGVHWSNQLQDGAYRIFAVDRGEGRELWSSAVPIQARAMLLSGKLLFVAGPAAEGNAGALLLALSAADGKEVGRCRLESAPVFDGMAAAYGRLYLAGTDGKLVCLAGEK